MTRPTALGLVLLWIFVSVSASFWSEKNVKLRSRPSSEALQSGFRLSNVYATALSELQALELQPLCHRVAARLLVSNCQLLDGKDEATVLTDSGRQLRDFIDSYAASLAICDLERGKFSIPSACTKFQESTLSAMNPNEAPVLHVSSQEIDLCLSALATSDAAWNTWVSYRHKALRFCEAARVDNEKAQSVLLFQRLTKVIAKLTDGVEDELQKRMDDLHRQTQQATENMQRLDPQINNLREQLSRIEKYVSGNVGQAVKKSSDAIKDGLGQAEHLQQLLAILLKTALESNSEVAVAQQQSLELVTRKANDEMGALMAVVTGAVASSITLQNQIEISQLQAAELETKQGAIEQGLKKLVAVSEELSTKYDHHFHLLRQAGNITDDILDTLEEVALTASGMGQTLFNASVSSSWWPYIICPVVTLVMGSYGLPPSAFRNLALVTFGEVLGAFISSFGGIRAGFIHLATTEAPANTTFVGF